MRKRSTYLISSITLFNRYVTLHEAVKQFNTIIQDYIAKGHKVKSLGSNQDDVIKSVRVMDIPETIKLLRL